MLDRALAALGEVVWGLVKLLLLVFEALADVAAAFARWVQDDPTRALLAALILLCLWFLLRPKKVEPNPPVTCPRCQGNKQLQKDGFAVTCDACHGVGLVESFAGFKRDVHLRCNPCNGTGYKISYSETYPDGTAKPGAKAIRVECKVCSGRGWHIRRKVIGARRIVPLANPPDDQELKSGEKSKLWPAADDHKYARLEEKQEDSAAGQYNIGVVGEPSSRRPPMKLGPIHPPDVREQLPPSNLKVPGDSDNTDVASTPDALESNHEPTDDPPKGG